LPASCLEGKRLALVAMLWAKWLPPDARDRADIFEAVRLETLSEGARIGIPSLW
jgi:hypothetical protein